MASYDDYKLEDAEDAAMKNSQMAKRVALAGAGVAGVGAAAFAATQLHGSEADALSQNDLAHGMNAGTLSEDILEPEVNEAPAHTVNTNNVRIIEPEVEPDPDVQFNHTTIVVDSETGEYVGGYDEGTIDGKDFAIIDHDGDGRADVMAYDANGNHIYEEDEFIKLDDDVNINIGNGRTSDIVYDESSNEVSQDTPVPNDYYNEDYDDLAYNNPDYNNQADFSAEMEDTLDLPAEDYVADTDYMSEDPIDVMPDDTIGMA